MSPDSHARPSGVRGGRSLHVFLAAVIALAVVGYLKGLHEPVEPQVPRPTAAGAAVDVPTAPTYAEMPTWRRTAGAPSLAQRKELPLAPPPPQTEELLAQVRVTRAENRAFDGSPPTIPHPLQEGVLDCRGCHDEGLRLGDITAPRMSHAPYTSCTQCHVPQTLERPWAETPSLTDNSFAGLRAAADRGDVLPAPWPTAPPSIPHQTLMRTECLSCHGPAGADALRTPHPERASCVQCHVGSALLDQRVSVRTAFP